VPSSWVKHSDKNHELLFWDVTRHGLVVGTDVSGQPIGPILKGKVVQEECWTS